ncbi:MAG: FHA domain-containing protein, partial [Deltaproteobacteria bacterium]
MAAPYALQFISGKYQGGEFPLPPIGELHIGRAAEADIVLVEDLVSRRHARLTAQGEVLTLQDLSSTNGTLVNGEKVERASLQLGDRIVLGSSTIQIISASELRAPLADRDSVRQALQDLGARGRSTPPGMSGELSDVQLSDLLQL